MDRAKKVKRVILTTLLSIIAVIALIVCVFAAIYASRFKTISSLERITAYNDELNLYCMNIEYDYDLDRMIAKGITDTQ